MGIVSTGAIAIWTGTIAGIPSGWNLCDGTNGTPDLRDRFVKGAPADTEAGSTGGSNSHTHTYVAGGVAHTHSLASAGAHTHTTASGGSHTHGTTRFGQSGSVYGKGADGAHTHTVNSFGAHTHTSGSEGVGWVSHTHTQTGADDTRPPYYTILFIQAGEGGADLATGIIIIWTGLRADIPSGWSEKTELREKFIQGASNGANGGSTGGSETHSHITDSQGAHTHAASDSLGNHTHTFNSDSFPHRHTSYGCPDGSLDIQMYNINNFTHKHADTNSIGAHTHTLASNGAHTHTCIATASLPIYKDIIFISCTTATSLPSGGILIWVGLIANIPTDYSLCNGTSPTPDLRTYFVRGAASGVEAGGTGGTSTHGHTDGSSGDHSHTQDAFSTAHQHSNTNYIGGHNHTTWVAGTGYGPSVNTGAWAGDHLHSFTNDAWSHTHTPNTTGAHLHTINDASTLPAYYEVQFIWNIEETRYVVVTEEDLSTHIGFEWDEITYTATVLDSNGDKLPATFLVSLELEELEKVVVLDQALDASVYSQSTGLLTLVWYVPSDIGEFTIKLEWITQEFLGLGKSMLGSLKGRKSPKLSLKKRLGKILKRWK